MSLASNTNTMNTFACIEFRNTFTIPFVNMKYMNISIILNVWFVKVSYKFIYVLHIKEKKRKEIFILYFRSYWGCQFRKRRVRYLNINKYRVGSPYSNGEKRGDRTTPVVYACFSARTTAVVRSIVLLPLCIMYIGKHTQWMCSVYVRHSLCDYNVNPFIV